MKYIRILLVGFFLAPVASFAANEFMVAAQLLAAAKNADIQQVQALVNNGADINYVDSTGLSVVCTALMNNDMRAAQILQMYGADASKCDQQIKRYNSRKPKTESGGLFSGLSSAQSVTLAAAGAAVVIGGLLLLTDVLDPGNDNDSGISGGDRPNGGGGTNPNPGAEVGMTLPYGPAMPNAASERENYSNNLNYYSPTTDGLLKDNFKLLTDTYAQNYLLMMHGYSALARGYMGMRTLRNTNSRVPIDLKGNNLGPDPVLGGRPVNVALITTNGVNATTDSSLGDRLVPWTTTNANGTAANGASNDMISSKYYNNKIIRGPDSQSLSDDSTVEDAAFVNDFDLSGHGTAIHNGAASATDNLLGKVVGGKDTGYTTADYMGFMPNGQMTIFRTGGGTGMKNVTSTGPAGTYTIAGSSLATGDTLVLFGKTLTVTRTGNTVSATDGTTTYNGYLGADGYLYLNTNADGTVAGQINQAYVMADGNLTLNKQLGQIDYMNYRALLKGGALWAAGDLNDNNGRSRADILANASIVPAMRGISTETINTILASGTSQTDYQTTFINLVNKYYDQDTNDGTNGVTNALPGTDAMAFFQGLGSSWQPLVLFSTGSYDTGNSTWAGQTQTATFENAAPLVFSNLEHLFASVVAVGLTGVGTAGTSSVTSYSPTGKIAVQQWRDQNGTPDDPSDDKYYKARVCGVAGRGTNGLDPWCFAAAGLTDELAVSSMAGAAGAVKSAFDYLNNKQLFTLLALTADGPYLGTTTDGQALTKAELQAYLQNLYILPDDYQFRVDKQGENYLDVFKEVFGYGLVNIERATKPDSKIYFYDGNLNKIVTANGNAYWRQASRTVFRSSSAFNPRAATISAPFYDKLESTDGELAMPRVWRNEFELNPNDARGLYMDDVLGELRVRADDARVQKTQIGAMRFELGTSDKAWADNLNGLDTLGFEYDMGNLDMAAGFQRHFTDGASRFDATGNPILALASNAITGGATYNFGRWAFGARAYTGAVTDETLLENDPTVTAQNEPARLGLVRGGQASIAMQTKRFDLTTAVGVSHETQTVLGAQTGGLLSLGQGDTTYVDVAARFRVTDNVTLHARSTFARTTADAAGEFILGVDSITSDALSFGVDAGAFTFAVARPLAVTGGRMQYSHADYDIVETPDGKYDLVVSNTGVADLDLRPEKRELRFTGTYRRKLGEFTDGAFGFIYRINPNNISEFGNESVFMLKFSHRLGV